MSKLARQGETGVGGLDADVGRRRLWFTSSTSFANSAVTIGRTLSDTCAGRGDQSRHRRRPERDRIDLRAAGVTPKSLTEAAVRQSDAVITMGCGDTCPTR